MTNIQEAFSNLNAYEGSVPAALRIDSSPNERIPKKPKLVSSTVSSQTEADIARKATFSFCGSLAGFRAAITFRINPSLEVQNFSLPSCSADYPPIDKTKRDKVFYDSLGQDKFIITGYHKEYLSCWCHVERRKDASTTPSVRLSLKHVTYRTSRP
jgi:hypothetical protein